jgi:hypothetical protein
MFARPLLNLLFEILGIVITTLLSRYIRRTTTQALWIARRRLAI